MKGKATDRKRYSSTKLPLHFPRTKKKQMTYYLVGQGAVRGGGGGGGAAQLSIVGSLACSGQSACPLPSKPSRSCLEKGCMWTHHLHLCPVLGELLLARACTSTPSGHNFNLPLPSTAVGVKIIIKFKDVPLSKDNLLKWCKQFGIFITGVYSRSEAKPVKHSPCIINTMTLGV